MNLMFFISEDKTVRAANHARVPVSHAAQSSNKYTTTRQFLFRFVPTRLDGYGGSAYHPRSKRTASHARRSIQILDAGKPKKRGRPCRQRRRVPRREAGSRTAFSRKQERTRRLAARLALRV